MITDVLAQSARYNILHPLFARSFEFLKTLPASQAPGRYDIQGDDCFALVQGYNTKPVAQAVFEAHRKYIDIQFIQAGRETIFWAPLSSLPQVTQDYSSERDIAFFAAPQHAEAIHLRAGGFVIFFPEDGHAPGVECAGATEVRKAVIKIRV